MDERQIRDEGKRDAKGLRAGAGFEKNREAQNN